MFSGNAQEFNAIGINVSGHTSYYKLVEYKSEKIAALDLGFNYDVAILPSLLFRTGLSYNTLGEKESYLLTDNSGATIGKFSRYFYNYYLSAPFQIHGKINMFWAGIGFNVFYYLNSRIKDQLNDIKSKVDSNRQFLLGFWISMGIQEKISEKIYFNVYGYYNPVFSSLNSINYGINAGLSFVIATYEEVEY